MKFGIYSIRDSKTGFMTPVPEVSDETAIRNFSHTVVNSPNVLSTFVQDFDLYKIADFEDSSGEMFPVVPPAHVISGPAAFRLLAGSKSDQVERSVQRV